MKIMCGKHNKEVISGAGCLQCIAERFDGLPIGGAIGGGMGSALQTASAPMVATENDKRKQRMKREQEEQFFEMNKKFHQEQQDKRMRGK